MSNDAAKKIKDRPKPAAIDVVIVNYNSENLLFQCLQCLIKNKQDNHLNIVVVDNGSHDASLEAIQPLANHIKLIKNEENTGFAAACNQGAALGNGHHIAFVNPDCFISANQLSRLSEHLNHQNDVALVGCRVLNEDGSLQAASRRRLPSFWRVFFHVSKLAVLPFFRGINIKGTGRFDTPIKVEAVNGACYVMNRSDFKQINGFDEGYPLHFEDLDLFVRIIKQQKSILYDSQVEVTHLQGQSKQDSKIIKRWKQQGLKRFFNKHRPVWESKLVNWLL